MVARGPLVGVQVLDLSRLLPGPYATRLLVDMGARVDKLESPGLGDYLRDMPPQVPDGTGACFHELNKGKRSLCLDLKSRSGAKLFRRLVARYDVLVESFRPGVMDRLGLGLDGLCRSHPRLVGVSIVGYPDQSSWANKAGHDLNFLARSGLLTADWGTTMPTAQVADVGAALYAVTAICGALYGRERDGKGQRVRVAMSESVRGFGLFGNSPDWHAKPDAGAVRKERGLLEGAVAAYNLYETADGGRVALAALEPKFWARFSQEVGLDPHPRATLPGPHQPALVKATKKAIAVRPDSFWEDFAQRVDCCLTVVGQDRQRGPAALMDAASVGHFGDLATNAVAPKRGEHSEAIVREALGETFDDEEFATWKKAGLFG